MLPVVYEPLRCCDQFDRRELLRVGSVALAGLSLPMLTAARRARGAGGERAALGEPGAPRARAAPAGAAGSFGRARSCILFNLMGGPPQHETWDPKPDAPAEVRGESQPIATSVPGLSVGEWMPLSAGCAHHVAVLRAAATDDNAHSSSGYYMLTGRPHQPRNSENARPGAPNVFPSTAALVKHLAPLREGLPPSVVLPEHLWNDGHIDWPGQDAGFLGRANDPWLVACDPAAAGYRVPQTALPEAVSAVRLDRRLRLSQQIGAHLAHLADAPAVDQYEAQVRQALSLVTGPAAQRAFDLERESPETRQRYGRTRFGQSVLLARRLVEAGVALVQVNWTRIEGATNSGWDTHARHTESLKSTLMPVMDQAYSALVTDLAERGLLDETLVVWMGEFGRTPRFNANAGRDHWGWVFSIALAGGGVQGGVVHGQSDRLGAYPLSGRVGPEDLSATVLHLLGIDPETTIHDTLGRPLPASTGRVIAEVL